MVLKILKVLWVFSLLAVLTVLMYVYAGLPEAVVVNENTKAVTLSKEILFYTALALIAIANALVFAVSRIYSEKDHDFKAWFYGFILCANLFFIIGLSFISTYNSGEKFDYSRLGVIIYGSLALMAVWIIAWPVYALLKKFNRKQPV